MIYPPLFKRVAVDHGSDASSNIRKLQDEYESFWKKIQRMCPKNSERSLAMRKMQESCMWMTRAIALDVFMASQGDDYEEQVTAKKAAFKAKAEPRREAIDKKPYEATSKTKIIVKPARKTLASLHTEEEHF